MFKNIIFVLLVTFISNTAFANMYKCKSNGKTTYQEKPCKNTRHAEFSLKNDISKAKQQQAALNHQKLLVKRKEAQQLAQENENRERLIRAEELKAYAAEDAAFESRRQANALEDRNKIEAKKRVF